MSYNPRVRVWMEGYWQSASYFKDIRKSLIRDLRVTSPLSDETVALAETIRNANSICVHLRMLRHFLKGVELMSDRKLGAQHYLKSMKYLAQRVDNPLFVCFSDAPHEVKSQLSSSPFDIIFVTHNKGDDRAHEDFYLMSQCRHFILSNSTFGWWPAWLCDNKDKIVIAPPTQFWDNRDILPDSWLRYDQIKKPIYSDRN